MYIGVCALMYVRTQKYVHLLLEYGEGVGSLFELFADSLLAAGVVSGVFNLPLGPPEDLRLESALALELAALNIII